MDDRERLRRVESRVHALVSECVRMRVCGTDDGATYALLAELEATAHEMAVAISALTEGKLKAAVD